MMRSIGFGLAFFLVLGGCASAPSKPAPVTAKVVVDGEDAPHGQLPTDVRPTEYVVSLSIDPEAERFSGRVSIGLILDKPRANIWMHGRDITVTSAKVLVDGEPVGESRWEPVLEDGVSRVAVSEPVPAGAATLELEFNAAYSSGLEGLYRVEVGGAHYVFTQFEAISARKAFPCFDEPAFKTPFRIALDVPATQRAATNTLLVKETKGAAGSKHLEFAPTEKLPTYLIAMAVGPLDIVEAPPIPANSVRTKPLPFRGIAVKGQGARLEYALKHTPAIVAALEDYFGIAYAYDKLDIVAVPDFAAGAMENAGMITFREQLLLLDPATTTELQRRGFGYVMAHELAHQWFGNLVTMKWWDDIWLNEAFATWMGTKAIDAVHPEDKAPMNELHWVENAMDLDALANARQIRQPIESNHDIENAFDGITYSKGGGVLAMFETWVTPPVFQKGIRQYMADHRFGNATYEDLLAALSKAAERDVATPFKTFLFQPGVPLLGVELSCEAKQAPALTVTQSRYLPLGSKANRGATWQVPVCVRYEVKGKPKQTCSLITEATQSVALEGDACPSWVMPNVDAAGYFRFALGSDDLKHLRDKGWAKLSARERVAVTDSLQAAFHSGDAKAEDVYSMMPVLAKDTERTVMTAPMGMLSDAWLNMTEGDSRAAVEAQARKLYSGAFQRLGWTAKAGEDGEKIILRAQLAQFLARIGKDPKVRAEAAKRGRAYIGTDAVDPKAVDPTLADTVVTVAIEEGDAAFFNTVVTRALGSSDSTVRAVLMGSIGSVKDPELAAHARALVFDERVHLNEIRSLLGPQMTMPETRADAWKWLQTNWKRYVERATEDAAGGAPRYTASYCSIDLAEEVERFFGPKVADLLGGPRTLAIASEKIRLCAALVEKQAPGVEAYFAPKKAKKTGAAKN
ncbi:MAG: M1 family metallopeptidase [Polyangiales bacterium]|nr:M1 family metallopeptidase [Myxococcales bacterium]